MDTILAIKIKDVYIKQKKMTDNDFHKVKQTTKVF